MGSIRESDSRVIEAMVGEKCMSTWHDLERLYCSHLAQFTPTMARGHQEAFPSDVYVSKSWYLLLFGVAKASQGKGLGRLMIEYVKKKASLHVQSL